MGKGWIVYLVVAALAAAAGAYGEHVRGARDLAVERAGRAADGQRHAEQLLGLSRSALDAEQRAMDAHDAAAAAVAAADRKQTEERVKHETENRDYRAALREGAERLRVAVTSCSAAGGGGIYVPGAAGATSVGDGTSAYADLDPETAERVFAVAGDDENQIDKLRVLQAYVCAVRPSNEECR
ncbi:lysis system i-spanin subunit Rz [Burkholderia gladioli]|uniref:lysis system i-spanin subunit Rz n=1 Tax=Burkholderia gladioli TaxID=28095 RepID=UPI00156057C8|nr:lysis system i-spanin subunit Rz [Burkholderia gladioli]NRF86048.1 lysis protein [Burkholderia gladioli]